tara:strand:+ start:4568 stop:5245 length:678 start_codon:yes stop_codon:yes gene_type:complete
MKISRRRIRQLIRESREEHIQGIRSKLVRLNDELENRQEALDDLNYQSQSMMDFYSDDPYAGRDEMMAGDPIRDQIYDIENKITLLQNQLDALEAANGGPVGQLPRGRIFEEVSDLTDEKQKEIDDAVADYLAKEGGAASEEGTEDIVRDKVDGIDAKSYLSNNERFKQLTVNNDPMDYYDTTLTEARVFIREKLEKIGFYKKYGYGLDDIPNKTKAHDDIIGHT